MGGVDVQAQSFVSGTLAADDMDRGLGYIQTLGQKGHQLTIGLAVCGGRGKPDYQFFARGAIDIAPTHNGVVSTLWYHLNGKGDHAKASRKQFWRKRSAPWWKRPAGQALSVRPQLHKIGSHAGDTL